jgi:PAS domain S-box-containing protein
MEVRISRIDYLGQPAILVFHRDITERKKAEQMIRESEARFREVVDQAPDGITVHDFEGNILTFNQRDCMMFGYSPEEYRSLKITDTNPRVNIKEHREKFWETMQTGQSIIFEGPVYRKDGSAFYQESRVSRIDYLGQQAILVFHRDITERKQAEAEINRRMERERLIAGISSNFVNADLDSIDSAVQRSLEHLCAFFSTDRGYIYLMSADQSKKKKILWQSGGITPHTQQLDQFIWKRFADSRMAAVQEGRM